MIFLDMDGVLCDFVSAAFRVHGKEFKPEAYPRGVFNLETVIGCSTAEFWHRIDNAGEDFWTNLEPYPWAKELTNELLALDRVIIATSPSHSPNSYSGKRKWLIRMGFSRLQSMFGSSKQLMARPGRWLVDDAEHNISAWRDEGGRAVIVPQPWNFAAPVSDPVEYVLDHLLNLV